MLDKYSALGMALGDAWLNIRLFGLSLLTSAREILNCSQGLNYGCYCDSNVGITKGLAGSEPVRFFIIYDYDEPVWSSSLGYY